MSSDRIRHPEDAPAAGHPDRDIDAGAAEGLRLIVAFARIKHRADRHALIDLAEWLGNCCSST